MRLISLVLVSLAICACGGRVAQPIALDKAYDDKLSCAHYTGEYENNIKRLVELTGEKEERLENNIGLLLVSPLFLDFSGTIKDETQAIADRNARLKELMAAKNCDGAPSTAVQQPEATYSAAE